MKPIRPRPWPWKFVKFNWTQLIVTPSIAEKKGCRAKRTERGKRREPVRQENWMDATKSTGICNATEKHGNLLDRTKKRAKRVKLRARLSRVETSIGRNSRNPLTSGQGNSVYRCGARNGAKRSSRGIRGSLKATVLKRLGNARVSVKRFLSKQERREKNASVNDNLLDIYCA